MSTLAQEWIKEGHKKGREEGLTKGEIKAKHKIAQSLLQEGFSVSKIAKITKLTPAAIKKLSKPKLKKNHRKAA